ncbi:AFH_G0042860.mRNA.1.CDS.1 [Saccharomyces cerevisiae]|nr:AFH_G0042860.mRNA.1.CDS.1 [Saccharomyces cerevisiae]CAI6847533.1 AFH_G0042860.mRNA.1.CDS.1 [Saccharomyces cerevisiae]
MTPEQKAKLEANRKLAIERLRKRGILSSDQLNRIESRNEPLKTRSLAVTSGSNRDDNAAAAVHVPNHNGQPSALANTNTNTTSLYGSGVVDGSKRDASVLDKRPTDRIRPSIRKQDYIEYDFATMQNLNGGYINPKDKLPNSDFTDDQEFESEFGSKKQKTLQDWKKEQLERKMLYENAPPPEHISKAPKCIECHINIEMDPVLHDVFKLQVCKQCSKEHPEKYALLTKTECKEDYFLTDPELNDEDLFHRLEKPNPHSGTFARMQLFVRCEVEAFAFKKWGGEEGLDEEWQRREEGKAHRREKKYEKKIKEMRLKTRAQEYTNRLREKKHGKAHIHHFSDPVDGGIDEDGYQIQRRRCTDCGLETEEIDI